VRQHPEAFVDQALVVERLERPHDALHVVQVERLVVVGEVDPPRLPGDVPLPLPRVAQHRGPARVVELGHAELEDLRLGGDAELPFGLHLGGQAVGVPAEPPLHPASAHGVVARDDVLDVPGEQVPVVGQPVGERRPVVEDVLVAAVLSGRALLDAGLEGLVGRPVVQHSSLQRRQVGARRYAGGVLVQWVGHRLLALLESVTWSGHHARTSGERPPAVPPRLAGAAGPRPAHWPAVTGRTRPVLLRRGALSSGGSPVIAGSSPVPRGYRTRPDAIDRVSGRRAGRSMDRGGSRARSWPAWIMLGPARARTTGEDPRAPGAGSGG